MSSHLSRPTSVSATGAVAANAPASTQCRTVALRAAWMAHTVKRALAAVGAASDADYGAFGWERGDLMVRLQWLRDDIERRSFSDMVSATGSRSGAVGAIATSCTTSLRNMMPFDAATPHWTVSCSRRSRRPVSTAGPCVRLAPRSRAM